LVFKVFWPEQLISHPIIGDIFFVLLALGMMVLRQLCRRSRLGNRLNASLGLVAFGFLFGAVATGARWAGWSSVVPYLDAVLFGAVSIGAVRAALTLFVDFYLRQREGAVVSAILRDIASVVAYFVVIVMVLRSTLDINVTSLITTSAVLTVIVGLALQDVLSNLFSGVVLELEQPFSPGDWVRIGHFEGTVEETGWRTTKIRTRVNELVTLPNAMMSKEAVINFSRPDPRFGDTLFIDVAYEAPPSIVRDAVISVLAGDHAVLRSPEPEVRLDEYRDSSIRYAIRFWITDFDAREHIRNRVMTNLWYALRRANVRIPFPARDLFLHTTPAALPAEEQHVDAMPTLRNVPLLAPLDDAALGRLAAHVRRHTFGRGEVVVHEQEAGDSFYVIERGAADVTLSGNGLAQSVGQLQAGDFFGEMSLLAGEPRTATVRAASDLVVLVVDRAAFREIISADPAILEPLSEIAARRQAAQEQHRRAWESPAQPAADAQGAQRLRERIRALFGL
jgi:small-conductance mechanosensitive channel/CRP-like cAMP-binding protein